MPQPVKPKEKKKSLAPKNLQGLQANRKALFRPSLQSHIFFRLQRQQKSVNIMGHFGHYLGPVDKACYQAWCEHWNFKLELLRAWEPPWTIDAIQDLLGEQAPIAYFLIWDKIE